MESAPQSTITHNAVIEVASDLYLAHAHHRGSGGRIKKKACPARRTALNRRDHAKITSRAQRRGAPKPLICAAICAGIGAFRRNARNGCRTGGAAVCPCPAYPETSAPTRRR